MHRTDALSRRTLFAAAGITGAVLLSACSSSSSSDSAATSSPAESEHPALTASDLWVKAADDGMTGMFGTLTNHSAETITVTGATSDAATSVELHESAADGSGGMSMKEKEGGFPIEPGGTLTLEPGGDHIMLMGLNGPLHPGDDVTVTVTTDTGISMDLTGTVKEFSGANEEYEMDHHGDHGSDGGH